MEYLTTSFSSYLNQFDFSHLLQKCLVSGIVLIAVVISIKITFGIVDRIFDGEKAGLEPRDARRIVTLNHVTKTAARASIWTLAGLIILGQFINVGSLLAVAGVGTLAIGFGAQGIVEDVMSGFVIVFENQFSVGDYVIIDETHYGIVETIGMRTTSVREFNGGLFIIHNGKIDRLVNYSKGHMKAIVEVSIAYEENIDKVMTILEEICTDLYENHEELFKIRPEVQGITRLDPSAVVIRVVCEEDAASKFAAENLLRQRIKTVFDEKGIEIPYNKTVIYNQNSVKMMDKKEAEVKYGN
ncbi:mechanosensitive ion channel family protein [Acetobacterium wieringae]|jgi:small conductance mechanosensitive channel|uniref:Mechanosensitive ion channel family protein n=1 Tax=Acetobacterium wieringae TaxID=52694 RepID=A0A1F2PJK1_9FIRM|nr:MULTISPECIES: mechanosensitive ion channel family protein [Acetobacterium]OFV71215.1 putative MscS family protein YkuT [Acetobacterium wieringae]OXS26327.1 MAG: mechanosensitive ion channel protein MscS [Acetobacterium sp. MES1]UYO62859.1 mechanosensitive ion channel family protein [Acetobacterium wieringae]VUZ26651.1 Small-conductance mechanosensitive channel [Acetobacterium wieringae]